MRTLLTMDLGVDPAQLVAILHFDGTPITARLIRREIAARVRGFAAPLTQEAVS
jgi:2-oxoglutarate ferredoxin oxidoreductase subunit alpha